jgi:hypothetical protein
MPTGRRSAVLLLVAAAVALGACRGEPPPAPLAAEPVGVFVDPAAVELRAGETVQLLAQVNDAQGRAIGGASLDFESRSPAIAHVTPNGLVAATGPVGTTAVHVASGSRETLVPITVRAGAPRTLAFAEAPLAESAPEAEVAVAVRVVDAFGNPAAGTRIELAVTGGGGAIEPAAGASDGDGVVRATWRLGTDAGEHVLEARADRLASTIVRTTVPVPVSQEEPPPPAPAPEPPASR